MNQPAMNRMPGVGNLTLQHQNMNNASAPNKKSRIRRPMHAFILWSRAQRRKIALEHPNMNHRDISKILGAKWNCLSAEEKKPFIDEAKRLRSKYRYDHPDFKYRSLRKRKPAMKPSDPHQVIGPSPAHMLAQTVPASVFPLPPFSVFRRFASSSPPMMPSYGSSSMDYASAFPYALQTSITTSELPGRMSANNQLEPGSMSTNSGARSEVSNNYPNYVLPEL